MQKVLRRMCALVSILMISTLAFSSCSLRDASSEETKRPTERTETAETTVETEAETTAEPETSAETETEAEPELSIPTDEERAQEILNGMSLEEKVGQMFLIACPSTDAAQAASYAGEHHVGGYVFFAADFENESAESFTQKAEAIQAASKVPMIMAVDEEGGIVTRVSRFTAFRETKFLSPREIFASGGSSDADENGIMDGVDALIADAAEKAGLLASIGLNVNLAPVCDISTTEGEFMYDRSLGENADTTSAFVKAVVETSMNYGVGSVLKHFPGYGSTADTHTGAAVDSRAYETFVSSDFLPFSAGIAAAPVAVMVNHNTVEAFDTAAPASMSTAVHAALRGALGFTGVIMTDDLAMDAVTEYAASLAAEGETAQSNAVLAVLAGNDMICTSDYETELPALINAVGDGTVPQETVDASVLRILLWKISLGLM